MIDFSVVSGDEVSAAQWQEMSELFSSEYGFYSQCAPRRAGQRIRLGVKYYEQSYGRDDYRIALGREDGRLVAQAIYRETETARGRVAFVVQLVVAEKCRRRGIASTLLHAVWGFSDYYAWGIVTSNAYTVESLESATFRRTNAARIAADVQWLREEVLSGISFLASAEWRCDAAQSRVFSNFFTDRSSRSERAEAVSVRLGELKEGEEWLAVVFRDQTPDDFAAYRTVVDASSGFVAEAYRRMPQESQPWAQGTQSEIDTILACVPELTADSRIGDFGAGGGRHLAELRRRGFRNLVGIDNSPRKDADSAVIAGDCRTWRASEPLDLILCLYDVIGSYSDDADNRAILGNIAANLRPGGSAVISVSNFGYLEKMAVKEIDFNDPAAAAKALFELPPSKAMWHNGEFFDAGCMLIDRSRRVVCHKEQFPPDVAALPGEYLIRDRRFTAAEIEAWAHDCGLQVLEHRFVRAGFAESMPEDLGKEILLISRRR